jgi:ABC-type phosphate transport system substrate-binding protein
MRYYSTFTVALLLASGGLNVAGIPVRAQETKAAESIAVVVNPQNTLNDIKLTMLRKVVLGEQSVWGNRLSVALVLPEPGTPEREAVLRAVAEMTGPQFKQHWLAKVFRGEASAEPLVFTADSASAFVAEHPGAIAFVEANDVRRDLKVLKLDGIAPGEEGYLLH